MSYLTCKKCGTTLKTSELLPNNDCPVCTKQKNHVQEMWAIKVPSGRFVDFSDTPKEARDRYSYSTSGLWKMHYRRGCRCEKVQIRIKPKPVIKKVWSGTFNGKKPEDKDFNK